MTKLYLLEEVEIENPYWTQTTTFNDDSYEIIYTIKN